MKREINYILYKTILNNYYDYRDNMWKQHCKEQKIKIPNRRNNFKNYNEYRQLYWNWKYNFKQLVYHPSQLYYFSDGEYM